MADNKFDIGQIGMNAASDAANGIFGIIAGGIADKRQIKQQQKLTDMQLAANKQMGLFNYEQQMKMWHETNYGAQMAELEKAGLNPGLIYGMGGGAGGTTAAAPSQGASGGQAPTGGGEIMAMMQMKNQQNLIEAQTEALKAQANKTNVEAGKIGGVDTEEAKTRIATLTQGIQNAKAQEALTKIETNIRKIEEAYKDQREGYTNEILQQQLDNMGQEWVKIKYENDITKQTWQDKVKQIKQEATNAVITGALMNSNIGKNTAQIQQIITETQAITDRIFQTDIHLGNESEGNRIKDAEQKIQQKFIEANIDLLTTDRVIQGINAVTNGLGNIKPAGAKTFNTNNYIKQN